MRKIIVVLAAVLALTGAACSSKSSTSASGSPSVPQPTTTLPTNPPSGGCTDESTGPVFDLTQKDFFFAPKCLIVKSSQTLHLSNAGSVPHTFTIDGTQVDVTMQPGQTGNFESAGLAPGTYQFYCRFHKSQGMVGEIRVR